MHRASSRTDTCRTIMEQSRAHRSDECDRYDECDRFCMSCFAASKNHVDRFKRRIWNQCTNGRTFDGGFTLFAAKPIRCEQTYSRTTCIADGSEKSIRACSCASI